MNAERMNWENLLSAARFGRDASPPGAPKIPAAETIGERSEFDRDCGRILYSSAFRRMQDKTQVFPLGRNDYVRTRLTHSLEVANIGRALGKIVGENLLSRHPALRERGLRASHFAAIVAAASLAHDIGNPPFGHSGEEAIESALARRGIPEKFGISGKFEGNAQGFRLLTRIGDPIGGNGLQLTAAVLAAFMKYPCSAAFSRESVARAKLDGNDVEIASKKFGFIAADVPAARFFAAQTGLLPRANDGDKIAWARHPLAFLTEAADDLSYLIADLEDAFVSKIVSFDAVREFLFPFIPAGRRAVAEEILAREGGESAVRYVRAVAIGAGIRAISRVFLERETELLAGTFNETLVGASELSGAVKNLRAFSFTAVYSAPTVVEIELMGFRVIDALFDFFFEWVERPESPQGRRIARMFGREALADAPPRERLLHLLDTISGMTDSFALETYRKLHGI